MKDNPLVSVIVPTNNSEATIGTCLRSVKTQVYSKIEMIVVDNYSRDRTREIARKYSRVYVKGPERSSQRNFGSKHVCGDYLFFIDSDMELTPKVVEDCVKKALMKKVDAIIVPEVSVGVGFWAKCKALEKSCYVGDESIEAARFFKKSEFLEVGGYDEELVGTEDWDLNQRISKAGYRIGRINTFIKHHEGRLSLRETILKKHYYGKTLGRYRKKHPKEAKQQLRFIRQSFVKNWRKLAGDPIHALGMFFMKMCELFASKLGQVVT